MKFLRNTQASEASLWRKGDLETPKRIPLAPLDFDAMGRIFRTPTATSTPSSYYTATDGSQTHGSQTLTTETGSQSTTLETTPGSGYMPMVYRVNRSGLSIGRPASTLPMSESSSTSTRTLVDDGNPVASFEARDSTYEEIWGINPTLPSLTESQYEQLLREWSGGNHRAAKMDKTTDEESVVLDNDSSEGSNRNIGSPDMIGASRFGDMSKLVFEETNQEVDSSYASGSPNVEEAIKSLRRRGISVNPYYPHLTHNSLASLSEDNNENVSEEVGKEEKVTTAFQFSGRVPRGPPGSTPAPAWMSRIPLAENRIAGGRTVPKQSTSEVVKNPKTVTFKMTDL